MSAQVCRQCGVPILDLHPSNGRLCDGCRKFQENPDELSKRKTFRGIPFKDMKHMDEDDRIKMIAQMLSERPTDVIGLMVETSMDCLGKGDRYIEKIRALVPDVKVLGRYPGPAPETEVIKFRKL
jgi:hypothetical protein